jgi:hypothetical protein
MLTSVVKAPVTPNAPQRTASPKYGLRKLQLPEARQATDTVVRKVKACTTMKEPGFAPSSLALLYRNDPKATHTNTTNE